MSAERKKLLKSKSKRTKAQSPKHRTKANVVSLGVCDQVAETRHGRAFRARQQIKSPTGR